MTTFIVKVKTGQCPSILLDSYRALKVDSRKASGSEEFAFKVEGAEVKKADDLCGELLDNAQILDYTFY